MVIYLDNAHIESLDQHLRGLQYGDVTLASREQAVRALLGAIEQEK